MSGFSSVIRSHELLLVRQGLDLLAELPERHLVSGSLEDRRHVGDAVIETHLGIRRRVYEEDLHRTTAARRPGSYFFLVSWAALLPVARPVRTS